MTEAQSALARANPSGACVRRAAGIPGARGKVRGPASATRPQQARIRSARVVPRTAAVSRGGCLDRVLDDRRRSGSRGWPLAGAALPHDGRNPCCFPRIRPESAPCQCLLPGSAPEMASVRNDFIRYENGLLRLARTPRARQADLGPLLRSTGPGRVPLEPDCGPPGKGCRFQSRSQSRGRHPPAAVEQRGGRPVGIRNRTPFPAGGGPGPRIEQCRGPFRQVSTGERLYTAFHRLRAGFR